ncbi:MAG: hypothetical protein NE334_15100 [Lentisphaeraceae bacterium]|nr:hypothetical protein [Lentisphaeraceae bacterium]
MSIPKIIHTCWFGKNKKSDLLKRCEDSWKIHLSDYQFINWTEETFVLDTPFLKACNKANKWAFISDYARFQVLSQFGGIYIDTDMEAVRSFDELLKLDCFVGEEAKGRPTSGLIGAEKGHPFLQECMAMIDQVFEDKTPYMIAPEVIKSVLKENEFQKIKIFPPEFFYPYNPYDSDRPVDQLMASDITKNTYAIHHWNKGWSMSLYERFRRLFYRKVFQAQ